MLEHLRGGGIGEDVHFDTENTPNETLQSKPNIDSEAI